ncbi:MAG: UDP-N-acetylmuramoyl-L-alanyl-D-glutamate--2,6-diaminopimelate ligase [Proteobacteria bacterium]|nr:MAG: UDP-N-acetylmuramoyl-L-alanyl-D-glutamate--2,6-diaminopimelate ligase [Pseudomonadota bacterium]
MAAESITFSDVVQCLEAAGLLLNQKGILPKTEMTAYTTDTRKLENGDLFIAYKGVQFDAHSRVPALALQYPKSVFLIEDPLCFDIMPADHPLLLVKDSREAWSYIAALRYGNPQEKLKLVGVTGTNGKTSTVWFLRQILLARGIPCMTLGTIGVYCGDEMLPASHTTPDPDDLFKNFSLAVARGITWAAMEVSSHAIVQRRLGPIKFDAVAFTSFSRDHLDFHATMKEYFAAKWELFGKYRKTKAPAFVSTTVREHLPSSSKVSYAFYGPSEQMGEDAAKGYSYTISESRLNHSRLLLKSPKKTVDLDFGFGGDFVMDNFTAAYALVDSLEPVDAIKGSEIKPVPGRFEPVPAAARFNFAVIVDYAHTPDALEKTLQKLKEMTTGNLWVVFGCGGDRDNGKRPLMGEIAERIGDRIVVTSDNPRTEMPEEIINQILKGMPRKKKIEVIEDRLAAIEFACLQAKPGDSILIAGKGHEDYQIIGKTKFPFDDRMVAAEVLQKRI